MAKKRLWDTENKRLVWIKDPQGRVHQVRTDGDKLYVYYSGVWQEYNPATSEVPAEEYNKTKFENLVDQEVGYYDTNEPSNMYSWDEGEDVAYRFMNGTTVLQSGKVKEGQTPEYTGDTPTKSATAQYTYTFSGWKPTLGPISKKTDFKAQFTSTVNEYTVSIASEDIDKGTVNESSVADIPYGTKLSTDDNVLTIGEGTSAVEVTATAETGYVFSSWGEVPTIVTGNTSITASFELEEYTLTIAPNDETYGAVDVASVTASYGDSISASDNVLTIGETEITATAETGYVFSAWQDSEGQSLPATVDGALSIVAVFVAETPGE